MRHLSKPASFDAPLHGPIANYFDLVTGRPLMPAVKMQPKFAKMLEAERNLQRHVRFDVKAFYREMAAEDVFFPMVARITIMGAIDRQDTALFDRVRSDMTSYAANWKHPDAALAMQLVRVCARLRLRMREGYPKWLTEFDLSDVPKTWYAHVAFLGIRALLEEHRYEEALGAAGLALAVNARYEQQPLADIWLMLLSAIACRETHRYDEMNRWFRKAARIGERTGFVTPFLEYFQATDSSLDVALREEAPVLHPIVKLKADSYFYSAIRMRNHLTGGHVTEKLTRRQFYIARHVSYGLSYKELAEMMGVSLGRVRNLVSEIYDVLGIHSRGELSGFVW